MLVNTRKRLLRPQQLVFNIRTLVKYSAIAFCLSSNTLVTSSFSLEPRTGTGINQRSASKYDPPKKLQTLPFLVHRGGSINPLKMSSTSTEAVAPLEATTGEKTFILCHRMILISLSMCPQLMPEDVSSVVFVEVLVLLLFSMMKPSSGPIQGMYCQLLRDDVFVFLFSTSSS